MWVEPCVVINYVEFTEVKSSDEHNNDRIYKEKLVGVKFRCKETKVVKWHSFHRSDSYIPIKTPHQGRKWIFVNLKERFKWFFLSENPIKKDLYSPKLIKNMLYWLTCFFLMEMKTSTFVNSDSDHLQPFLDMDCQSSCQCSSQLHLNKPAVRAQYLKSVLHAKTGQCIVLRIIIHEKKNL